MMPTIFEPPSPEEVARVDAWRNEEERRQRERWEDAQKRRPCPIHGPQGRMLYGPAPYGYGPVCRACRREWSRRHGAPWESAEQTRERTRREHEAMVAEVEGLPPAAFYAEWEALRAKRHEETRRYHHEARPDEFGVNYFGSATPDGERYLAMRVRVLREQRAFEEARDAC